MLFINGDNVKVDFPFLFLNTTVAAKVRHLFEIIDTFIFKNNLNWPKYIGISTNTARSMAIIENCRRLYEANYQMHLLSP